MGRRNESPQKTAVREAIRDYLKADGIKAENGADFKAVMRDMMSMLVVKCAQWKRTFYPASQDGFQRKPPMYATKTPLRFRGYGGDA